MCCSALGLSHALGHKLGAAYGIPHGITSVSTSGIIREISLTSSRSYSHSASPSHLWLRYKPLQPLQRIRSGSQILYSTFGSPLKTLKKRTYWYCPKQLRSALTPLSLHQELLLIYSLLHRLVDDLGLHSTLTQYKVPKEDVPKIAEKALGKKDDPLFPKAVKLLENLY